MRREQGVRSASVGNGRTDAGRHPGLIRETLDQAAFDPLQPVMASELSDLAVIAALEMRKVLRYRSLMRYCYRLR
jgi:hypothetical protein